MNGSRLFVRLPPSSAAARGLDGTNKSLPRPLLLTGRSGQDVARAPPQIEANGSFCAEARHKNKQVGFTRV